MVRHGSNAPIVSEIASIFLYEYSTRLRMKDLGFTDSIENLDCISAEAFGIIGDEIEKEKDRVSKKNSKK